SLMHSEGLEAACTTCGWQSPANSAILKTTLKYGLHSKEIGGLSMHKQSLATSFLAVIGLLTVAAIARESWPEPTAAGKERIAKEKLLEEETWKRVEPIVLKQAEHGKPYIPSAAKPEDLPQADVPAFPGAEGAGRFSFGGRGGKVYVVTSLEDEGP